MTHDPLTQSVAQPLWVSFGIVGVQTLSKIQIGVFDRRKRNEEREGNREEKR